jgi:hypothetical protein
MNKKMIINMMISGAFISGCSDYKESTPTDKREVESCITWLKSGIANVDDRVKINKQAQVNGKFNELAIKEREELVNALESTKATYQMIVSEGEIYKGDLDSSDKYRCRAEDIEDYYRHANFELIREGDLARLDEMNRQIDKALDGVIDEYKRKAVRHRVSGGPGPRIDVFEMKDGSIVYCKTTVTDAGKAVSCE